MPKRNCEDWLDSYVELTDNSEPHEIYRRWAGISVIAATLQRKCWLNWIGSTTYHPNMYIVLVGPPAARKGTALDQGREFLNKLQIPLAADETTRQALIQALEEASMTSVVDNATSIHSSLTVFSPELTVFIGYENKELLTNLTDWFDCPRRWTYRTKGSGVNDIVNLFFNLIGATTPGLIRTSLPMDTIGSGLASRIIFVNAAKKGKKVARPFKTEKEKQLETMLTEDLERIFLMKGAFRPTAKFIDVYEHWYNDISETEEINNDVKFEHYCARRQLHLLKLSMILSASRSSSMVLDEIDFHRAHTLLTYTESKMSNTFAGLGKSSFADVTQRIYLELASKGTISRSEMLRKYYHDVSSIELDVILTTLEESKLIKKVVKGDGIWIQYVER